MKSVLVSVVICCVIAAVASPLQVSGQTLSNTKVLLHGQKGVSAHSAFGLAGWIIIPNPGQGVVVGVAGLRYTVKAWWVEIMAGAFTKNQIGQPLIDLRASYDALVPVHFWTNVQYFPKSGNWYLYVDANYDIGSLAKVGLETENMLLASASDDLSLGPRVVVPFSDQFALIGAYQFHGGSNPNQVWTRAVLNF